MDENSSSDGATATAEKKVYVILEMASLETVRVHKRVELLAADKHHRILHKHGRDANSARPDITHQCLMMLLDSPLNQAGHLEIFIHTRSNVLIKVNNETKIPRTFDRFAGLMIQLLHKLSVRASNTNKKLLKVVKNPVTDHLPVNCPIFATSFTGELTLKKDFDLDQISGPVAFVIGAMAHGHLDLPYVSNPLVKLSNYPISAALACAKILDFFEDLYGVF